MNQIIPLEVGFCFGERTDKIFPVILKDEQETILIDCGYPGFMPKIEEAARKKQIDLKSLTKIIITHHDYDHMGALFEFRAAYPDIKIISSFEQEPYISGRKKSLRLLQAEALHESLPEDQKEGSKKIQQMFASVKPAKVDFVTADKETFPWCGGAEIVMTQGHMPGHLSIYLKEYKTLIAGDALAISGGALCLANPEYTLDLKGARESVKKLCEYDIERIICYHGGVFEGNVKEALSRLV